MEGVYNEGILLKRQRGLRASDAQRRNLKFQKRFCRLMRVSLDYYEKKASLTVLALFIISLCMHNTRNWMALKSEVTRKEVKDLQLFVGMLLPVDP